MEFVHSRSRYFILTLLCIVFFLQIPADTNFEISPVDYNDTVPSNSLDELSSYSRLIFKTDATQVIVTVNVSNYAASTSYGSYLTIISNRELVAVIPVTYKTPEVTTTVGLPEGEKRIEITTGIQSRATGGQIISNYVSKVQFNQSATIEKQEFSKKLLIYGDSIAAGDGAGNSTIYGWPVLLRAHLQDFDSVVDYAWGPRTLWDDSQHFTEIVSKIRETNPDAIWLAIGTNDYGFDLWSANDFGKAYKTLLTLLTNELPQTIIYAVTPLPRIRESNRNGHGSNLEDYRRQIFTSSENLNHVRIIDGKNIVGLNDMDDGLHPNRNGQILYEAYVFQIITLDPDSMIHKTYLPVLSFGE